MFSAHFFEELDTVRARHIVIGDDTIKGRNFEVSERVTGTSRRLDFEEVIFAFEERRG